MQIAKWERGFETIYKADAQRVAEEIMSIGEDAHPEQIVEKAKDAGTELHKCFEWDDKTAAEKYRVHQARQIVCHLVIKDPEDNPKKPEIRYFFKTRAGEGYKPTEKIFCNPDEHALLIKGAKAELTAYQRKYSVLTELAPAFEMLNEALETMQ